MSDERDSMKAAIEALREPPALRVLHDAVVVDQSAATIGVKLTSLDAPSETAKPVPVWFGLPGFAAKFKANAETKLGFVGGREDGAFASLYPYYPQGVTESAIPLPIEYLSFGGGNLPIARKGDRVSCGAYTISNLPPLPGPIPAGLLITYQASEDSLPQLIATIVGPIAVAPDPVTIPIAGTIITGREEFRA